MNEKTLSGIWIPLFSRTMSEYKILKATEHSFADKKKEEEEKRGKNEEERERSKLTFRMLSILQANIFKRNKT